VLLFDAFELPCSRKLATQLPFYVEPAAEEVLISWLWRLASRLQISMRTLVQGTFQIDPRTDDWQHGHRPAPWVLQRMSHRTGVGLGKLRSMIFDVWAPFGRRGKQRFEQRSASGRAHSLAVCGQCLTEDPHPYLRLSWMIDWMGVCSRHQVILLTHCPQCRAKVCLPSPSSHKGFTPASCSRCGIVLDNARPIPVCPSVTALQSQLLTGKRHGMTEIEGLGHLSWSEVVALADVLSDMWAVASIPDRYFLLHQQEFHSIDHHHHRYGSLALLAALLRGWPHSTTAQIVQHTLVKSLARSDPVTYPAGLQPCAALQGEAWSWDERCRMQHKLLGISPKPTRQGQFCVPQSTNKGQSTNWGHRSTN
jgi:hypothetical protein